MPAKPSGSGQEEDDDSGSSHGYSEQNGDRSTPDARQPVQQQQQPEPDPAVVQQQLQQQYQLAVNQAAYNAQIPGLAMQQPLSQDQSLAQQPQLQMPHQQMPHPLGYGHDPASALFLQPGMQQHMQQMQAQLALQQMNPGQLQMQQGHFPGSDMAAHLAAHQGMAPMRTGTSMDSQEPDQQDGQADGEPKKSTRGRKKRTEPVKVTLESGESALLTPKEYRSHRRRITNRESARRMRAKRAEERTLSTKEVQDLRDELLELRQTKVRLEEEVRILREALEHAGQVPPMASAMHPQGLPHMALSGQMPAQHHPGVGEEAVRVLHPNAQHAGGQAGYQHGAPSLQSFQAYHPKVQPGHLPEMPGIPQEGYQGFVQPIHTGQQQEGAEQGQGYPQHAHSETGSQPQLAASMAAY